MQLQACKRAHRQAPHRTLRSGGSEWECLAERLRWIHPHPSPLDCHAETEMNHAMGHGPWTAMGRVGLAAGPLPSPALPSPLLSQPPHFLPPPDTPECDPFHCTLVTLVLLVSTLQVPRRGGRHSLSSGAAQHTHATQGVGGGAGSPRAKQMQIKHAFHINKISTKERPARA